MPTHPTSVYRPHFKLMSYENGSYWRIFWRDTISGHLFLADEVPFPARRDQTKEAFEYLPRLVRAWQIHMALAKGAIYKSHDGVLLYPNGSPV